MSMSEMNICDPSGHSKHIWDAGIAAEVEAAKEMFKTLTKKGYAAFHVKKGGEQGEKMRDFDREAEKMILVPNLQGG